MSNEDTVFYRRNKAVCVNFSSPEINTDGSLILLEKLEREHKLIKELAKHIPNLHRKLNGKQLLKWWEKSK